MQPKIRSFSGTTDPSVQPYELAHREIARRAAAESIVLLKNTRSLLPISPTTPLALYGTGAGRTIKGGTGSGDVNERYSVSLFEGLKNAGYPITTQDWIADADARYTAAREAWRAEIWKEWERSEADLTSRFMAYSTHPFQTPSQGLPITKTDADIALYVISRVAGEGADRRAEPGDYFLSDYEKNQLHRICTLYPSVELEQNTGGKIDLTVLDQYDNLKAVVQLSQPGCEGGHAFADVLCGRISPSGKLAATWARNYSDYPNAATFSHNNGNVEQEVYHEGIYVGYRYFDTFRVPVRFGFGYGLSYTDFALTPGTPSVDTRSGNPGFSLPVTVKNIGKRAGREVVQVYAACPQKELAKEARRLVAFGKTAVLSPGEEETLTLHFSCHALTSYDEGRPGWVLEEGSYVLLAGNSLDSARPAGVIRLTEDITLRHTRRVCPLQTTLTELAPPEGQAQALHRALLTRAEGLPCLTFTPEDFTPETVVYGKTNITSETRRFVDTLTTEQLIALVTGDPGQGQGSNLGSSGISVPGSAAQTSSCAREQGLADLVLADGPAGLRLQQRYEVKDEIIVPTPFEQNLEGGYLLRETIPPGDRTYYQYCTAYPVGTALAQSWDLPLLTEVGKAMADELNRFGVTAWLAPGMNLQRNPLCGRNFEYFSEDPLLTGRLAAAITRGVQQDAGCGTTVKHFACNNQEDNRMGSDSVLSERTLRELYLKGFELVIREAQPLFLMTSYNLINGIHAANNHDLCTALARDEWGFDGVIMTDWTATEHGPDCTAAGCMRAGNDLVMPGVPGDHENLRRELAAGTLTPEQLKTAVAHLVQVIRKSNRYE